MNPHPPLVDLADETFVVAPVERLAELVAESSRWARWWPDLRLTTTRDRGLKGRQWRIDGSLVGTAEIWLEPWADGVVVHFFLRGDRPGPDAGADRPRSRDRERSRRAQEWKRVVHAVKDELEAGRTPGSSCQRLKRGNGDADAGRDER